ncbi:MAG TPA: GNAT family protein [Caulobacteraceae bacterium]|jgi:RimJ/RimL family protein N-acetyltransferase|nr:GNAT family protein [Caulobacteraceae bacterium]
MHTAASTDSFWLGERIRLRPLSKADAVHWLAFDEDSEAIRRLNMGISPPRSAEQAAEWVDRFADFKNADEAMIFTVETHDGQYIGSLNLGGMDRRHGTFSTGTRLAREYRGKGYALEAKRIVLRYAFHELRLQKYNLRCLETNVAVVRHAALLGCQPEGRIRRNVFTDGRFYDELLFGLTREEFEAKEAERQG